MDYDYKKTTFSKALLAGVFAGILATCLSLVFNGIIRRESGLALSAIINVSTLIFSLIIILTLIGLLYHLFVRRDNKKSILYQVLMAVIFAAFAFASFQVDRSPDPIINKEFRELLLGVVIISGICAVFVIPFLYRKNYL